MNITSLFPIAVDLAITMPDGSPTNIVLKVVGKDSKQYNAATKKFGASMQGRETKLTFDELMSHGTELAAACLVGWSGLEEGDVPIPFSHQKALELLAMPELAFIREQLEAYVGERTNFFRSGQAEA